MRREQDILHQREFCEKGNGLRKCRKIPCFLSFISILQIYSSLGHPSAIQMLGKRGFGVWRECLLTPERH